jgi:hypothetical protein
MARINPARPCAVVASRPGHLITAAGAAGAVSVYETAAKAEPLVLSVSLSGGPPTRRQGQLCVLGRRRRTVTK